MWPLDTSSRTGLRLLGAGLALAVLAGLATAAAAPPGPETGGGNEGGKVFLTVDEALGLAFPKCEVERQTAYLTKAQLEQARKLAGAPVRSAVVHAYVACRNGKPAGTAYFDTHKVRTKAETLMIVVDAGGRVERVEVLRFDEPPEYLARGAWYGQFRGRSLRDGLRLKKEIRGITGASLTARATAEAVRRVLAVHQVLADSSGTKLVRKDP